MKKFIILVCIMLFIYKCYSQKNNFNMNLIEFPNGKYVFFETLNKETFDKRISLLNMKIVTGYDKGVKIYKGNSEAILVEDESGYYEYENINDFKSVINSSNNSGLEILYRKNVYQQNFPIYADKLAQELLNELGIKDSEINEQTLELVEKKLCKMDKPYHFYRKNFLSIIALVGIAIINKTGSSWHMELSSDKETWNIYLKMKTDNYPFFVDLYEDIFINNEIETVLTASYYSMVF